MKLSWYRGVPLKAGPNEPPYLTSENIRPGGVYSADGPDGIGDQYFEGLEHLKETQATWLIASTFPSEVERFLQLPIASIRILTSDIVWATIRVESVEPVGRWMMEATLGHADGITSIPPDFLAEEPMSASIRSWPASEPRVWLSAKTTYHPLKQPAALRAVFSMPSVQGRRFLIVPFSAESCYLVHDR